MGDLGWEDPLEKGQATRSSILAWRIPWTVYSPWARKAHGHDWATFTFTFPAQGLCTGCLHCLEHSLPSYLSVENPLTDQVFVQTSASQWGLSRSPEKVSSLPNTLSPLSTKILAPWGQNFYFVLCCNPSACRMLRSTEKMLHKYSLNEWSSKWIKWSLVLLSYSLKSQPQF